MNTVWKISIIAGLMATAPLAACTLTHKIEPSGEPIIININLNIQQEIRVRLDKDIENLLADNPDVF